MEIKRILPENKEKLMNLVNIIENNLENKEFWLPINEVSRQHFFDDEWTEFYGVFVGNDLIAAAALFYNEHEYNESLLAINRRISNVAEIGRAMVHPDYRGKNILLEINMKLIEVAQKKNIEYLIATIHPDNVASQKSFLKLGMSKQTTYKKQCGFVRDVFLIKL